MVQRTPTKFSVAILASNGSCLIARALELNRDRRPREVEREKTFVFGSEFTQESACSADVSAVVEPKYIDMLHRGADEVGSTDNF